MTKDVLVSLSGLQMSQEQEPENTEVISKGEYFFRNGKHFVVYDEIMEGINDPSKTKIKFTDNTLEVLRQDPRAAYQKQPDYGYGMDFAGYDIRFRVRENGLKVVDVVKTNDLGFRRVK